MKRILLGFAVSVGLSHASYSQHTFPLFGALDTGGIAGKISAFDGVQYAPDTTIVGSNKQPFLQIQGSDAGDYGGALRIRDTTRTQFGYTGNVKNTTFQLELFRNDVGTAITVLFNTASQQFGYTWYLQDSAIYTQREEPLHLSVPLWQMRVINNDTLGDILLDDTTLHAALPMITFSLPVTSSVFFVRGARFVSDVPLGLSDQESSQKSVQVYPNPCDQVLFLGMEPRSYTFTDAAGHIINQGKATQIDVSTLKCGLYNIRLEDGLPQKVIVY